MINEMNNLIGADISKAHLSWFYLSNVKLNQANPYWANMREEPDLRGITLKKVEVLIEKMKQHLQTSVPAKHPLTGREFMEQKYREGKILNLPKRKPLTEKDIAERARLAQVFAGGKPMSEMIIEDRGPR